MSAPGPDCLLSMSYCEASTTSSLQDPSLTPSLPLRFTRGGRPVSAPLTQSMFDDSRWVLNCKAFECLSTKHICKVMTHKICKSCFLSPYYFLFTFKTRNSLFPIVVWLMSIRIFRMPAVYCELFTNWSHKNLCFLDSTLFL